MLSPADAGLVRRDTHLPGLGLVLDSEAFGKRLAAARAEAGPITARAVYLRYKPHTSCLVAYRVAGPDGERDVHAIARTADAAVKLDKARHRAVRRGAGRGPVVLEECAVIVSAFPDDAALPVLQRLADADGRRRLLRRVVGKGARRGALVRLRYKPERRFVARVAMGEGRDVVIKAHAAAGFEAGLRGALCSDSRPPLAVARLLGARAEEGLLAFESMPGRPLAETLLSGETRPADLPLVGEAVAEIHGGPPGALLPRPALAEAHHVRAVASLLAFLDPGQAARAEYLGREIATRLAARRETAAPIHGDFHAGQVLLAGDAAVVLDFDEAALGDPASDLGSFVAHLEREACAGRWTADGVAALAGAFLEGYARRAPRPGDGALVLHVAAALFRLAPHFFRDRDPAWPERTEAVLDRVEACLGKQPGTGVAVAAPPPSPADDGIPHLAAATDPRLVAEGLRRLPEVQAAAPDAQVQSLRVLRHKPGRRCLVEYTLTSPRRAGPPLVVLGKVRARGADLRTCRLVRALYACGFDGDARDGVSVPRGFGALPELGLWLQARVEGTPATGALAGPAASALAARIADALDKLHRAPVVPARAHTVADELAILTDRLERAARERPAWAGRIARLSEACGDAAAGLYPAETALVHRDFYADQVLVDGQRLWLVDLDLCAAGDPALDVGNFAGHLVEQALRGHGDPRALDEPRMALVDRFLARHRRATAAAVAVYTTLTLARHLWLSTQLPERRHTTEALLDLCERRLDLGVPGRKVTHAV